MKKKVLWLIQSNQTTPVIIDFLQTMKVRTAQVLELIFIVPETASDLIEKAKSLNPVPFKIQTRTAT
ncbi:MAG: hypothetical protein KKH99_11035, partial [Proteobacteria bacterium]|nr:hypothetical protein [Pseudomonadota bacterium]